MENMERLKLQSTGQQLFNKALWKDRPTLVTGGAGFIGSWLSRQLLRLGARVYILDSKKSIPRAEVPYRDLARAVYISGDVCDQKLVTELLRKENIRTIFHLAAEAIVGEAYKNPVRAFKTNVQGTVTVLEAARLTNPEIDIVIASSDKAYGQHKILPYREDFPLLGRNPYDCTKSCADLVAQSYAATYGSRVGITRCGNVYGGGDLNFSRIIPDVIRSFLLGRAPEIRSDGNYQRDFIYVEDAVAAYVSLAQALARGEHWGESFNFGHNKPYAVKNVVREIAQRTNARIEPKILANARFEIKDQYLDASKAYERLGWRPTVDLACGLDKTILWYKDHFKDLKEHVV